MRKIKENIDKKDGYFLAYHRTREDSVSAIVNQGFKAGGGAMYGYGLYATYDQVSQFVSSMRGYGPVVLRFQVNPKGVLIFDYNMAKKVYGSKYTLIDQLIVHNKIYRNIGEIPKLLFDLSPLLERTFQEPVYSAHMAAHVFVSGTPAKKADTLYRGSASDFATGWGHGKGMIGSDGKPKIKDIRGIVFTGNKDGNVLVSYSTKCAIPLDYVISQQPDGNVPEELEWEPVKNYGLASKRAQNHEYILSNFGKRIESVSFYPPEKIDEYDMEEKFPKDFPWMLDFKGKNLEIELDFSSSRTPLLNVKNGIWKQGEFKGNVFADGTFEGGKFIGHTFGGYFKFGVFLKGIFDSGTWEDGIWDSVADTTWVSGLWKRGKIKVPNKRSPIETDKNPIDFLNSLLEKRIGSVSKEFVNLLTEKFDYRSLDSTEQDELYDIFSKSYIKAVGASWPKDKFDSRARDWIFYGEKEGGIALRKQRTGMYKLNAAFGSPRLILNAVKEMQSDIGNEPIWGVMTSNLAIMLEKSTGKQFKQPPKLFVKTLIPHIKGIFGDVVLDVKSDGGISVDTPAGPMVKYFIANKVYYKEMLDLATKNPDKLPVPAPVIKTLVFILKAFI